MPSPKDHVKHLSTSVEELLAAVAGLVGSVERSVASTAPVRQAGVELKHAASDVGKAASPAWSKVKTALKAHWANLTPAQHKARIRKMLAARGLKPKPKTKPAAR